jgi:hypothetical protein
VFDDHIIILFISGETKIIQANTAFYFKAGDIFLIPRNLLAAIPPNFKSKSHVAEKAVIMNIQNFISDWIENQ